MILKSEPTELGLGTNRTAGPAFEVTLYFLNHENMAKRGWWVGQFPGSTTTSCGCNEGIDPMEMSKQY